MKFNKGFIEVSRMFQSSIMSNQTPEILINEDIPINSYDTRGLTEKEFNIELSQQKLTETNNSELPQQKSTQTFNLELPQQKSTQTFNLDLSQQKLTEAIIWSEILGKPLCRRRKSR